MPISGKPLYGKTPFWPLLARLSSFLTDAHPNPQNRTRMDQLLPRQENLRRVAVLSFTSPLDDPQAG
jgi:hypothetical protein